MNDDIDQFGNEVKGNESRLSLSELTDEAGVSVRTVRYYVGEGLLPPPVTAGPRSYYTRAHLDRLRLIDRLKAAYLPLKEIRRRLTTLNDEEVRRLASEDVSTNSESPPDNSQNAAVHEADSASAYIARLFHRQSAAAPPAAPSVPTQPTARLPTAPNRAGSSDRLELRGSTSRLGDLPARDVDSVAKATVIAETVSSAAYASSSNSEEPVATSWRRISLGEDAELLVRDDAYQRKRDRIDWLIGWARKVLG